MTIDVKTAADNKDYIDRIMKTYEKISNGLLDETIAELKADGFEGDLYLEALNVVCSACMTFVEHIRKATGGNMVTYKPDGDGN